MIVPPSKKPRRPRHVAPYGGFSLMELLVAVALVAILGVLVAQITSVLTRATRLSNQGVNAAAQARLVFDRIGMDLGGAVIRSDADFSAGGTGTATDPFLSFLSEIPSAPPDGAPANFSNRQISAVSYRIGPAAENANRPSLLRGGRALSWTNPAFMGLDPASPGTNFPVSLGATNASIVPASADFDLLSPAVVAIVVGFQLRPDDLPAVLRDGTAIPQARGQIVYSPPVRGNTAPANQYVDTARIASVIVGLAVIDPERAVLLDAAGATALAGAFAGRPAINQLPVAKWMADTSALSALPASVPLPVRQSVRVYQKFFPLRPQ